MSTIEFHARVTNGRIDIPEQYRNKVNGDVHVILVEQGAAQGFDMIEHLLENPLRVEAFEPFTREEIYEQR
ncbi:MAG TPA: hypothetical protein VFB82_05720 [Blastocatellia bacterium]|nr:hypothetical protein [Blastocatellia bacterium]